MVPTAALLIVAICYLSFKVIEQSIIEESEAVVHNMAQNLLPALLAGDTQQVDSLLKSLESHPTVQTAELISGAGVPLASYVRDGTAVDPSQTQFALASADETLGVYGLHVTAPLTFDTQILANLHIAVNLWPAYLRVIQWLGLLLIFPSALYVIVKQMRIKIRFERMLDEARPGSGNAFSIDQALDGALQESDISLEYQPIKRVSDQGVFGAEVVICWRHPSGQTLYVSPADFIALAENSGFFLPFGAWVLETACKQFASWQIQHGPLVLTLNIAPSQLKDADFYQKVREVCASSQFPHQLIEFEINEAALLRSSDALAEVEAFVQKGMSLTVDGFGLSSRSHELLQSQSIHKIKFAPQLIKNIAHDVEMFAHLQSFEQVALAHNVQFLADGLHSEDQTLMMQKIGCVFEQGPYVSQPLPPKQFEALLIHQARDAIAKQKTFQQGVASTALGY
jgi:EAL domain-containing protein (putative c-di-GMP-specific phosphodiesterase class I)